MAFERFLNGKHCKRSESSSRQTRQNVWLRFILKVLLDCRGFRAGALSATDIPRSLDFQGLDLPWSFGRMWSHGIANDLRTPFAHQLQEAPPERLWTCLSRSVSVC